MTHDVPNLGVLDGSVFVTGSPVNPTSTIVALSLRAAEHILDKRASIPTPARVTKVALGPAAAPRKVEVPKPYVPTDDERARLADYADWLIPEADGMPSGRTNYESPRQLDRVLAVRPDLGLPLAHALAAPYQEAESALAALGHADPTAHAALMTVVAACYYTDREVMKRIGYEGQVAKPFTPDRIPPYITEGLLDHLLSE